MKRRCDVLLTWLSASALAVAATTRPTIPAKAKLGPPVAVGDSGLVVPAPKGYETSPGPNGSVNFTGLGRQVMITASVLAPDVKTDDGDGFVDRAVAEDHDKPNNNPNMKPGKPAVKDKDPRFDGRWHVTFTLRGQPCELVHLYRRVDGKVLHVQIGLVGPGAMAQAKTVIEIGEGVCLSGEAAK